MIALRPRRLVARRLMRMAHPFAPGTHLTDGRRLFGVGTHSLPGDLDPHASLEDCLTLAVSCHTPRELYSMRLSIVRPAAAMR
jgi:hypothetical protein